MKFIGLVDIDKIQIKTLPKFKNMWWVVGRSLSSELTIIEIKEKKWWQFWK